MIRKMYRNINNFFFYSFTRDKKVGKNVAAYGSFLEGKNKINDNTVFVKSRLGRGSYLGANCYFSGTEIGKYCSIGSYVKVITANHPSRNFVTTHPAFFSLSKQAGFTYTTEQRFQEQKLLDEQKGISVSIGNDVWIGEEAIIMGGVKIHNGAIIGARALVTRDIPPYAKVGGVPAKIIGKRFNEDEIEFLLNLKWWDKDESWIIEYAPFFSDIRDFIKKTTV
jgi:acetyltransferase-like isoleucine patch superfamily enzyme